MRCAIAAAIYVSRRFYDTPYAATIASDGDDTAAALPPSASTPARHCLQRGIASRRFRRIADTHPWRAASQPTYLPSLHSARRVANARYVDTMPMMIP